MGETCGVCRQNESKYKCPSCQLRYCSMACFKQHKETHANDAPKEQQPTQTTRTVQFPTPEPASLSTTRNPLAGSSKKIDFSGFESDPELLRLLSRYPNLRIQLQSVYGHTLEPPPRDQPSFSFRARGRGRGRGAFHPQSHWSQAKGDKEAAESFRNMRNAEGGAQALAEFVQLLNMRVAPDADVATT